MKISRFRGEYFPFSNTYPLECWIETEQGISVPSSEHAYMANRFEDSVVHVNIANARDIYSTQLYADAVAAKNLAHIYIREGEPQRYQRDSERVDMMRRVVRAKLMANVAIKELLLGTGDAEIIEGNDWGDCFWGVDERIGEGCNHLGKIYMSLRQEFLTEVDKI